MKAKEPVWVERLALELLHGASLARFGGAPGLRDEGLLDSALARPKNAFHYDRVRAPAALAASYAFGLTKNHPFIDGNRRAAFLACGLFLELNGRKLTAKPLDAYAAVVALAGGTLGETEFAQWLRLNSTKSSKPTP
jgi:death on curing protein